MRGRDWFFVFAGAVLATVLPPLGMTAALTVLAAGVLFRVFTGEHTHAIYLRNGERAVIRYCHGDFSVQERFRPVPDMKFELGPVYEEYPDELESLRGDPEGLERARSRMGRHDCEALHCDDPSGARERHIRLPRGRYQIEGETVEVRDGLLYREDGSAQEVPFVSDPIEPREEYA